MLSQTIRELRTQKEISQATLASVLGVTQQAVAKWERDKAEPDSSTIKQIAKYFNVSIDYLLDNDGANANTQPPLNAEQAELIAEYDALNDEGRGLIKGMLNSLRLTHGKSGSSTALPNFIQPVVETRVRAVARQ